MQFVDTKFYQELLKISIKKISVNQTAGQEAFGELPARK